MIQQSEAGRQRNSNKYEDSSLRVGGCVLHSLRSRTRWRLGGHLLLTNFNHSPIMNTSSTRFCCLALWAASAGVLSAGTIYEDDFDRTGALHGSSPSVGSGTWDAKNVWVTTSTEEGGYSSNTSGRRILGNAWLPFEPVSGKVYTLSLDIDIDNITRGWVALGFSSSANTTTIFDEVTNTSAWGLIRGIPDPSDPGSSQITGYAGPKITGGTSFDGTDYPTSAAGTFDTLRIELDTTGASWKTAWSYDKGADGDFVSLAEHTYSTNPTIDYVGFGAGWDSSNQPENAHVQNFSLSAVPLSLSAVPEPSNVLIGALLGVGMLRRKRRD